MEKQLASVAALQDSLRRDLYFYVSRQPPDVSRDQAAKALGISRALAAFHLDKLVEAGLLEASFRRLSDRRGPGAGRPSKLYRRSAHQIDVSLPERRYELAASLMASALAEGGSAAAVASLRHAARAWGEQLGTEARGRAGSPPRRGRALAAVMEVLREAGFEPRSDGGSGIVLANCPFDALARANRDLVCGMNHTLIEGVLAGLRVQGVHAKLDPQPGRCCVAIGPLPNP